MTRARPIRSYVDDLYEFVLHHPGASRHAIVQAVTQEGPMTEGVAHKALSLLRKQGQVTASGRGDEARFWIVRRGSPKKGWLVAIYDGAGDLMNANVLMVSQHDAKIYACERFRVLPDAAAVVVKQAEP